MYIPCIVDLYPIRVNQFPYKFILKLDQVISKVEG